MPPQAILYRASLFWTVFEGIIGSLIVFAVDLLTGSEISVGVFYLFPVFRVAWKAGKRWAFGVCIFCTVLWMIADLTSDRTYSSQMIAYWNTTVRFGYFFSVAYLSYRLREERNSHMLMARTDSLTGLPNRLAFLEVAGRESHSSLRRRSPLSVAYIDLDNFKLVNDRLGHSAGDELLRQVGHALKHAIRTSDLVSRLGGDEFAILLPKTELSGAQIAIRKVREHLMKTINQNNWPVTLSIGCITFSQGATVEDMVRRADELMYDVKHGGKNTINFDMTAGETCRVGTQVV